jgi:hypothetical protein
MIRNRVTTETLFAHLSCTADLPKSLGSMIDLLSLTPDDVEVAVVLGSNYDSKREVDTQVMGDPSLVYYSTDSIVDELNKQLSDYNPIITLHSPKSDEQRAVAVRLATGEIAECDAFARTQVIDPLLEPMTSE